MSSEKLRVIVLAGGLLSAGLSIAGDKVYLCRATSAYDLDDSGRLVPEKEKGIWVGPFGKEGISFSIDRDTGEMIGTGFNTDGGWSVKVLNQGRSVSTAIANYHAIIPSAVWPESGYQVQSVRTVYVHEESSGPKKSFSISDNGVDVTGLCE